MSTAANGNHEDKSHARSRDDHPCMSQTQTPELKTPCPRLTTDLSLHIQEKFKIHSLANGGNFTLIGYSGMSGGHSSAMQRRSCSTPTAAVPA